MPTFLSQQESPIPCQRTIGWSFFAWVTPWQSRTAKTKTPPDIENLIPFVPAVVIGKPVAGQDEIGQFQNTVLEALSDLVFHLPSIDVIIVT